MPFPTILLTDPQLQEICNWCSEQVYIYYPVATNYFKDLLATGARPMELLTPALWNYIDDDNIELQPLKDNSTRTFTAADLTEELLFAIINQVRPYNSLSLRQLKNVLQKLITFQEIRTEDKSAIEYMFRYNYIKQLHNAGFTDAEIQEKLGWSTPLLSASYYNQNLYLVGDYPPIEGTMYLASLTQSGAGNPVASIIKDNTGFTFSFIRIGTGFYWFQSSNFDTLSLYAAGIGFVASGYTVKLQPLLGIPAWQIETIVDSTGTHSDDILNDTLFSFVINN